MGTISVTTFGADPQTVNAANLNALVTPIITECNGSLDNTNIKAAAGIVDTKLATITTAGKVNTSALITTSQAAGDVIYNDGTNWVRLAKDAGKYLKSGASAVSWDVGFVAAVQSDQETATSNVVSVTPGTQQYHPSACKAWCRFNGETTGTNAPTSGYNVTSVTRNSTGNYTITFTTAFSGDNTYCVIGSVSDAGAALNALINPITLSAATCVVIVSSGGSVADEDLVCLTFFGDQ